MEDLSAEAFVRDIEAVTKAVGAERFAITAWEETSIPALLFCASHPESVIGLVLRDGIVRGADVDHARSVRLAREDWHSAQRILADGMPNVATVAALDQVRELINHTTTAEGFIRYREQVATWDAAACLASVRTPTLVTNDGWTSISKEASRRLAASLPNGSFVSNRPSRGERSPTEDAVSAFLIARYTDEARAEDAPAQGGLRTVLFTDIVGHTEMMQRLGDVRGRDVLREHERITRETLKAHGGAEVKTMGDGFMASFCSVTSAMDCAIALQRAFAARESEPIQIRVGLNAGEPIEEDGDLFGATVILAARIAAKAGGGDILVPDTVRGLLSGKGFVFGDRGDFVPKGFDEGVRLWDVRWRDEDPAT